MSIEHPSRRRFASARDGRKDAEVTAKELPDFLREHGR